MQLVGTSVIKNERGKKLRILLEKLSKFLLHTQGSVYRDLGYQQFTISQSRLQRTTDCYCTAPDDAVRRAVALNFQYSVLNQTDTSQTLQGAR